METQSVAHGTESNNFNSSMFDLQLLDEKGQEECLLTSRSTLFSHIMNEYSRRSGHPIYFFRLFFNGRRIKDTDTPELLNLEPDDIIEVKFNINRRSTSVLSANQSAIGRISNLVSIPQEQHGIGRMNTVPLPEPLNWLKRVKTAAEDTFNDEEVSRSNNRDSQSEIQKGNAPSPSNTIDRLIKITFTDQKRKRKMLKANYTDPLIKVFKQYAKLKSLNIDVLQFSYGGIAILHTDTLESIGVNDHFDIKVKQIEIIDQSPLNTSDTTKENQPTLVETGAVGRANQTAQAEADDRLVELVSYAEKEGQRIQNSSPETQNRTETPQRTFDVQFVRILFFEQGRHQGGEYTVTENNSLEDLLKRYAQIQNHEFLSMRFRYRTTGKIICGTDTAKELGMNPDLNNLVDVDVIESHQLQQPFFPSDSSLNSTENTPTPDNTTPTTPTAFADVQKVKLKLTSQRNETREFLVATTTEMGTLFREYAMREGHSVLNYRFTMDGSRIKDIDTPSSLQLQNEDVIEVFELQQGGFILS